MKSFDPFLDFRNSDRRRAVPRILRIRALLTLLFLTRTIVTLPVAVDADATDAPTSPNPSHIFPIRLNGDSSDHDGRNIDKNNERRRPSHSGSISYGFGREFSVFQLAPRGGTRNENHENDSSFEGHSEDATGDDNGIDDDDDEDKFLMRMQRYRERRKSISSISSAGYNSEGYTFSRGGRTSYTPNQKRRSQQQKPKILQKAQNWWADNIDPKLQNLPKIVCRMEPTTRLKLRKTFRPLKTIVRLGADYNTQQGIWQFKSSWEDDIIGGKLTLSGNKELQITKSWSLSVGGVEDLVTRLRFRATINLQTFQAYARVGFRTERLTPIDVVEGFTILKQLPLDGSGGNLKLEVKANVALPEPEIEYSTEAQRSVIGMGNIEVSIDEMNLLLDY